MGHSGCFGIVDNGKRQVLKDIAHHD